MVVDVDVVGDGGWLVGDGGGWLVLRKPAPQLAQRWAQVPKYVFSYLLWSRGIKATRDTSRDKQSFFSAPFDEDSILIFWINTAAAPLHPLHPFSFRANGSQVLFDENSIRPAEIAVNFLLDLFAYYVSEPFYPWFIMGFPFDLSRIINRNVSWLTNLFMSVQTLRLTKY